MSKISTYEVAPVPKLSDKLIGTSVGGEIEDVTYNFTLLELLELFLPVIPANNLQGVLDYGNTATQDINLFGTITTTNLDVTDTANLFITYLNEETHLVGSLFDSADSVGTAGQVLTSTGDGVAWFTLPPIFTPNLQQVLEEGNTADLDIILDANLEALDVSADTATVGVNLTLGGTITDNNSSVGSAGQVLESTVTGVQWTSLPVYSATSPLLFNSGTGVFSIQPANSTQGGYLTSSDWITFDGKQNAGSYITALTGEATATGPGSVPITLNNASVIAKVLTGLNVTGGSISASDSILTAFGKVQNQINGLIGGVQYQGTWNAATNTPTLISSVGTQGHFYIVSVAGNTDLNGITDWKIGDWAIFSGGAWSKVDNTESVTSVNGQIGAVSLTTDDIPEGATNLYYLDSRARGALSFAAGSGAYNSLTGVITIPTNNNQILNGANYITLASLSATGPLAYNNLTGVFSIQQATALLDGYLSATDWSTFNSKQNYLGGTGLVKSTAGTITYITDNSGNWNTAYNDSIISASVTGTTTKTLTLNQQDGGTIQASWTDLDTGLTSVGVSMPAAFSVANSPLTANGTIAITGAGTTLQYIDGTGALQTFPGLTGFVPYTGANQNVNLGEYGISAGYFQADLTPSGALQVGRMQWNNTDGTMDLRLLGNNVTLQIGEENVSRVVNKSGIDLLEENYQVVRLRKVAEGGAQGQRIAVVLAQGNTENNSTEVLGLVTETINANQEGFITCFGEVKEINTTGSLQGETWVDGDILYLSSTVAGALTNIRPVAPNHSVIVGYVSYAHAIHGKIYMAIDTGYELGELHNVYAPSPTNNQSIYWNSTNSRYQLNTIGGILGYTPANAAILISTTAPLQGGGDLSANRTLSITQAGASTDGYLSSTDWNTFNNKQPAGSYVPTSRLLSINGTQYDLSADRSWSVGTVTSVAALTLGTSGTDLSSSVANGTTTPVITLNVPTASAANRGALSAADWSTFNTKVGGVTASSPLASSGGQTPNITIQQASGSQDGYLSSTDWTTFNNKQAAGNYITSLTGEATASGPGAAAVTLNNASVTGKVLTGVNITGGSISATDSILTAFGKVQNQINGLIGSTIYQGTWNAATNTPALASGVGTRGYYYIVNVAGTTNLDGITDWFVGDWAIFDGTAWQQVDNTDAVVSVNGQTGAVSLTTDNIPEGATNQYFLNSRARAALSFTAGSGAYNSTTGVITIPTNTSQLTNGANFITLSSLSGTAPIIYNNGTGAISITQAGTASNGFLSSTDWNTFNNKQGALTLTTTGTSGAATLIGTTLNIPNYGSALTGYVPYTGATAAVNLGVYGISGATASFSGIGQFQGYTLSGDFGPNYTIGLGVGMTGGVQKGVNIGWNNVTDFGFIGTVHNGTAWKSLVLNPISGNVYIGATGTGNFYAGATTISGALNGTSAIFSNIVQVNGSGSRPVIIDSNVNIKSDTGGWAMQHGFIGSSGTARGGYGAYGSADALVYYYIGIFGAEKLTIDYTSGAAGFSSSVTANGGFFTGLQDGIVNQENGTSLVWKGRILSKNSTANVASFLGTYGSIAGVFAHNNALTDWADLYVNNVNGVTGGNVRMPTTTYINGYAVVYNSGTWGINISGTSAASTSTTFVSSPDGGRNPNTAPLPTTNPRSVSYNFADRIYVTGATGNYAGVMTYAPWDGTSASTGDSSYQLAFCNWSGVNASGLPGLALRNGINSSWNSTWYQILHSGNYTSYAVPTSGYTFGTAFSLGTMYVATGAQATVTSLLGVYSNGYAYTFGASAIASFISGYYVPLRSQSNWNDGTVINNVVGLLSWKNYGSNHVIFDASAGTSPSGGGVSQTNATVPWTATYPTLMGWNGVSTYGVRVDSARVADSATLAPSYLPLAGGTMTGSIISNIGNGYGLALNRAAVTNYNGISLQTAGSPKWFLGMRENLSSNNYIIYSEQTAVDVLTLNVATNSATFYNLVTSRTSGNYRQATLGTNTGAGLYVTNVDSGGIYGLLVGSSYSYGDVWLQASRTDGTVSAYNISLNASGGTVTVGATQGFDKLTLGGGKFYLSYASNSDIGGTIYAYNDTGYQTYAGGLKLQTFRNVTGTYLMYDALTLAASGAATFNSSVTATDFFGTRSYAAIAPTVANGNWVTSFQNTPVSTMAFGGDVSTGGPTGTWWFQVNMRHSNPASYWGTQLAYGWEDNANEIYQRNVSGNNFSGWVRYLNSNNYNLFAPSITGANASGTWGISITGNAATASFASAANRAYYSLDGFTNTGTHGTSYIQNELPAAANGAATGRVVLYQWCSEPGITWDWAGFGYNVLNNGGSPSGFGRFNGNFGQAYMRFASNGDWYFYNTTTGGTRTTTMSFSSTGVVNFSNTVTAAGFFESSDSRLKQVIEDNYKAVGIQGIKPKLYIKNGKEEVGYFAQDFESILASAVSKNNEGFLNLSYTQVHTAKIAIIEDEVDVLKRRVTELEFKLQKYEA